MKQPIEYYQTPIGTPVALTKTHLAFPTCRIAGKWHAGVITIAAWKKRGGSIARLKSTPDMPRKWTSLLSRALKPKETK